MTLLYDKKNIYNDNKIKNKRKNSSTILLVYLANLEYNALLMYNMYVINCLYDTILRNNTYMMCVDTAG